MKAHVSPTRVVGIKFDIFPYHCVGCWGRGDRMAVCSLSEVKSKEQCCKYLFERCKVIFKKNRFFQQVPNHNTHVDVLKILRFKKLYLLLECLHILKEGCKVSSDSNTAILTFRE